MNVKMLVELIDQIDDGKIDYEGPISTTKNGASYLLTGRLIWDGQLGMCELIAPRGVGSYLQASGKYGEAMLDSDYITLTAEDQSWTVIDGVATTVRTINKEPERITVQFHIVNSGANDRPGIATALVLSKCGLPAYPGMYTDDNICAITDRRPGLYWKEPHRENSFLTNIFGRTAIIQKLSYQPDDSTGTVIIYEGNRLEQDQEYSIALTLSYLSGQPAAIDGFMLYDSDGLFFRQRRSPSRFQTKRAYPPIHWEFSRLEIISLSADFSDMLEAMHAAINNKIKIDVAMSHLFAENGNSVELEIRDITLALDVLIESKFFRSRNNRIVSKRKFKRIFDDLLPKIETVLKDYDKIENLRERIQEKIKEANDLSISRKRQNFWDKVGFQPSPRELKALRHRNPMSHSGYILMSNDEDEYQALLDDVAIARTLVNITIASLLKYKRRLFNYFSGETDFPEQIRTEIQAAAE